MAEFIKRYLKIIVSYMNARMFRHYDIVLFLDFDGVLAPFNDIDYEQDKFGRGFDTQCVENLSRIVAATSAKIVVTSSWRGYLSLWRMMKMWQYRKLPNVLVGATPTIGNNRSKEIDVWLARHKVCDYVILDDMDARQFEPHHHSRLITCDGHIGVSQENIERAICLLSK